MDDPRFVPFGGVTTLPPPYLCESAELFGFFFRAAPDRLVDLCRTVFREPTGGAVDYRPLGSHVLVTFGRIKRMSALTPPFDGWGHLAEDQVVVWVPVVAVEDPGAPRLGPRLAMFVPYIWLDDPLSMATGREAGGWPKSWGWPGFSAPGEPLHLRLDVYGWQFAPDQCPGRRPLLAVTEAAGRNGHDPLPPATFGHLFGRLWSTVLEDKPFRTQNLGLAGVLLKDALRAELPQLFFKQIRSAGDADTAALQQVITSAAKVRRFSGQPLFGEHHLTVWSLDSCPVRNDLGLVDQVTRLGFKMELDFVQDRGRVIWDAAAERHASASKVLPLHDPAASGAS